MWQIGKEEIVGTKKTKCGAKVWPLVMAKGTKKKNWRRRHGGIRGGPKLATTKAAKNEGKL
jgi:hypothetical protein